MNKDQIYQRISDILQTTFGTDPSRIKLEAQLGEDLDIDSIDAVDLIVQLKPLIGGNMRPEAFKTVRTVSDVVETVYTMMHTAADAPSGG